MEAVEKINILIVDDTPVNVRVLEAMLFNEQYDEHYNIVNANSGKEALEILNINPDFGLFLLDVNMPDMDGFELAFNIRQNENIKRIPIIFITASFLEEEKIFEGYNLGAVDYLIKPINNRILTSKVAVFAELYKQSKLMKQQAKEQKILNDKLLEIIDEHKRSEEKINTLYFELKEQTVELESQLMRIQRLEGIGQLASGISHDINNSLTPILMSLELLLMKNTDDKSGMLLESIKKNTLHCSDLVKQILNFAGGLNRNIVNINLSRILTDIIKMISATMPSNIRLETELPDDLHEIFADETQINQIIINLIINARDAMPEGGKIKISAKNIVVDESFTSTSPDANPGKYVMVSVADNGSGIPEKILDKIFKPFFTTKEIGKGTGLGLSTVMGVVKKHGGFIEVLSSEKIGTEFCIYFPSFNDNNQTLKVQKETEVYKGNGETILIVDDDEMILEIIKYTLEEFNYNVITALNGSEAIALYLKNEDKIKVVITDYSMPIMNGIETIYALKKINPEINIIAASGSGKEVDLDDSIGSKVKFISKPYLPDDLLKLIHNFI